MKFNLKKLNIKWTIYYVLLGLAIAYTIAPLVIAFSGVALANLLGCSGGAMVKCPGNEELSNLLSGAFLMHWLFLMTLPTGGIVVTILIVIGLVLLALERSKQKKEKL